MQWEKPGRREALMTQIVASGVKAFLTQRANVKEDKTMGIKMQVYDQSSVWMNPKDGILTLLKLHQSFAGATWPKDHGSILQVVNRASKSHNSGLAPLT